MADLSASKRAKLPKSDFAIKSKAKSATAKKASGNYPIPDVKHARNALARVAQHGSPAEQARVKSAVKKKFPGIDVEGSKKK